MKNFMLGLLTSLFLIALLAADSGYNVVWESELKRPEAQKAISDYVESHCDVTMLNWEIKQLKDALGASADQSPYVHLNVHCPIDQPAK